MVIKTKPDVGKPAWAVAPATAKLTKKAMAPSSNVTWTYPDPGTNQVSTYWAGEIAKRDAAFVESHSKDLTGSRAAFRDLVLEVMTDDPVIYDGNAWAARPMAWYAEALQMTDRHVQRLTDAVRLRKLTIRHNGKKTTLLRWGKEQRHASDDLARIMQVVWKKKGKAKPTPKEYGMLLGLARDWPYPYAPDLFKTVIDNWSVFMGGVKVYIDMAKEGGDFYEKNPGKFHQRYLRYPSIPVIRRFWRVAPETYTIVAGNQGSVPEAIQKVMMSI